MPVCSPLKNAHFFATQLAAKCKEIPTGSSNTLNAMVGHGEGVTGVSGGCLGEPRPRHPTWSHSLNIQERPRSMSLSVNRSDH